MLLEPSQNCPPSPSFSRRKTCSDRLLAERSQAAAHSTRRHGIPSLLHAMQFRMRHKGFTPEQTVFAGDNGNELPVLTSRLHTVPVRNARDHVGETAPWRLQAAGQVDRLDLARGNLPGMDGNYAAGVLEGLTHFLPEPPDRLRDATLRKTP